MFHFLKKSYLNYMLKDKNYQFLFQELDDFVCFDCETTSLNVKDAEIISIGAIRVQNNRILLSERLELLIKPEKEMSENSIKIHQLRHCDLENGVTISEAIVEFLNFIKGSTLVGYYLEFDIGMVNKFIKPLIGINLPNRTIEVSALYFDKKIPLIPNANIDLSFDTILKDLQIPSFGKHSAINDALMTAMMFVKLKNISKV